MKVRHTILTIAAVMVLAAPTTVLAQMGPGPGDGSGPGPHGGGPGRFGDPEGIGGLRFFEHMLPRLADELGLSDEQLTEIQAIVDAAQLKIDEKGWIEELEAARDAYRANHENSTVFDEDAFREHVAAQHLIQTEIGVVVGQARADALGVLTAEQLAQLEEMRTNFGGKSFRRGNKRRSSS